eukprot:SAG25_NODE_37_length_19691_cov_19.319467_16_plen_242_part_00
MALLINVRLQMRVYYDDTMMSPKILCMYYTLSQLILQHIFDDESTRRHVDTRVKTIGRAQLSILIDENESCGWYERADMDRFSLPPRHLVSSRGCCAVYQKEYDGAYNMPRLSPSSAAVAVPMRCPAARVKPAGSKTVWEVRGRSSGAQPWVGRDRGDTPCAALAARSHDDHYQSTWRTSWHSPRCQQQQKATVQSSGGNGSAGGHAGRPFFYRARGGESRGDAPPFVTAGRRGCRRCLLA